MRLDLALVDRHILKSRSLAKQWIEEGFVLINGKPTSKANATVQESDEITVTQLPRFVSRAGEKLDRALEFWNIDVRGKTVLDIGSSTGGFTDCLLQREAKKVIAVDVGTDQFDTGLKNDARIELHEQTDIRDFQTDTKIEMIVCDASFISLTKIIPHLSSFMKSGLCVLLVKPQFEVGPDFLNKQGIVTSPDATEKAIKKIKSDLTDLGWKNIEVTDSPILGGDGNKEYLLTCSI